MTIDGTDYPLDEGFLVVATQNPIEQQGTYPLPEAQLDRFLFKHVVDYPDRDEERQIVNQHGSTYYIFRSERHGYRAGGGYVAAA